MHTVLYLDVPFWKRKLTSSVKKIKVPERERQKIYNQILWDFASFLDCQSEIGHSKETSETEKKEKGFDIFCHSCIVSKYRYHDHSDQDATTSATGSVIDRNALAQ